MKNTNVIKKKRLDIDWKFTQVNLFATYKCQRVSIQYI